MKVYFNNYRHHWLSPNTMIDYLFFWTDWSKCHRDKSLIRALSCSEMDGTWTDRPDWVETWTLEFISSWGKHVDFIRFYFETCPYKRVTGLIWLGKLTFKALNTLASSGLMVPTPDMGSDPLMETR